MRVGLLLLSTPAGFRPGPPAPILSLVYLAFAQVHSQHKKIGNIHQENHWPIQH